MKVKSLTPRKLEKLMNAVHIEKPKNQYSSIIKSTHTQGYNDCIMTLERFAEQMDPKDYILARRYLSSIELHELSKSIK